MPEPSRRRRARRARRWQWPKITRDGFLIGVGTVGFMHEVFIRHGELSERVYVLAACVAMMGLAPILRLDERRREEKYGTDDNGE